MSTRDTAELIAFLGLSGMERAEAASLSYGGQRLLDMGLALATPAAASSSMSRSPGLGGGRAPARRPRW